MASLKPSHMMMGGVVLVGSYAVYKNGATLKQLAEKLQGSSGGGVSFPDLSFLGNMGGGGVPDLSFLGGVFDSLTDQSTNLQNQIMDLVENSKNTVQGGYNTVKDKVTGVVDLPQTIVDGVKDSVKGAVGGVVGAVTDKVSGIPEKVGISPVKAGATILTGAGAVGVLSGVSAPIIPFTAVALGDIFLFTKLRKMTIDRTGKKPETIVADFFKGLFTPREGHTWKGIPSGSNASQIIPYKTQQQLASFNVENRILSDNTNFLTRTLQSAENTINSLKQQTSNLSSRLARRSPTKKINKVKLIPDNFGLSTGGKSLLELGNPNKLPSFSNGGKSLIELGNPNKLPSFSNGGKTLLELGQV